jgi:formate hydrogenlyase subunit 6/NADH:ubiquinone oxidoreductase subunit I
VSVCLCVCVSVCPVSSLTHRVSLDNPTYNRPHGLISMRLFRSVGLRIAAKLRCTDTLNTHFLFNIHVYRHMIE